MSRLIVKNLPKSITESELRKTFGSKGSVTDSQLKFTRNGAFRKFAFVGFQTEEEAQVAKNYFDGTFIGTSRIQVETCAPLGDSSKPRAWSKYAKDSSAYQRIIEKKRGKAPREDQQMTEEKNQTKETKTDSIDVSDPKYQEFLEAQNLPYAADVETKEKQEDSPLVAQLLEKNTDEQHALVMTGLPSQVKLKNVQDFLTPVRLKWGKIARDQKFAAALLAFKRFSDLKRVQSRNGEYFGGFKVELKPVILARKAEQTDDMNDDQTSQPDVDKEMETVADTGRIFVKNLSYFCTEENLQQLFEKWGQVTEVMLPMDRKSQRPKGFAIVTFLFPEHAVKAFTELDGTIFQGRMLHLIAGQERPGDDKPKSDKESNFKEQKKSNQMASAGSGHNWNSLFLGSAAVAEVMADELDADKSQLLDPLSKASIGVRLALGETRIVRETREFLLKQGVALDSFSRPDAPRNKFVILVKNLPPQTKATELRSKFERFGELGRVVLPPAGISALAEFLDPEAAKNAFKNLAYSRFGSVPLYLEWAPGEVFSGEIEEKDEEEKKTAEGDKEAGTSKVAQSSDAEEGKEEEEVEEETTLFVKNLNFDTTDEVLARKFEEMGRLNFATVAKKKDRKRPGETLSMGYGFVQFMKRKDALNALKLLQGSLLDGHCLELKLSQRDAESIQFVRPRKSVSNLEQGDCTKILVRNIPFQASKKELQELFSAFGETRFIRLPRKVEGGHHRGFAFVDFLSKTSAKRAFKALCHSTHLFGRRLVLEWAKEEESLDDIRKRTAEHFLVGVSQLRRGKEKRKMMDTLADL